MAQTKNTQEVVGQFAPMGITTQIQGLIADIPKVVATGNYDEVVKLRRKIENFRDLVGNGNKIVGKGLTKTFDDCVSAAMAGFNGEDFLCKLDDNGKVVGKVTTIINRENRGRKAKDEVVPAIDATEYL